MDQARQRLLFALGASALLHLWLAQTYDVSGARRVVLSGAAPLIATLDLKSDAVPHESEAQQARMPVAPPAQHEIVAAADARREVRAHTAAAAPAQQDTQRAFGSGGEAAAAAPASDPTYYTARSLDVYPRALTALDLGLQNRASKVRATVLIDESGAVNEVRAIEAGDMALENATRDLLLRTRFTPAQKDGRIVKSQLLVSLEQRAQAQQ